MGVTIESKNYSLDYGYSGFAKLRTKVAELTAKDIYEHYKELERGMFYSGERRKIFFENYNAETDRLSKQYNREKDNVLDFLYASDCGGEMDVEHCKSIYDTVKDYDDDICYGYSGRTYCAMFKDFKNLLKDCIDSETPMEWY